LSFVVTAVISANGSSVTLTGLSFHGRTAGFNVYRGSSPANLLRVASGQAIATTFTDGGLTDQLIPPPDPDFDHANFYWRSELQPEVAVTTHSPTMIGNATLQMAGNAYVGMTVRITRGTGAGQERSAIANDATTIMVSKWDVEPDATSFFTVRRQHGTSPRSRRAARSNSQFRIGRRGGADYGPLGKRQ
jgi:hypothetical protein